MTGGDANADIAIRAATPADADTIARFSVALADESEDLALDPDRVTRGVRLLMEDPERARYWVAEANGEVVGQCMVTTEWSDWWAGRYWWLQSVYVIPEWRGRGVLRRLWDAVLAEANGVGDVAAVRLYVEQGNRSAREAYARLGMEETTYQVYEARLPHGASGEVS